MNEYVKVVLILSNIPITVQIGIGRLDALQLVVDDSKLLSQKKWLLLLREGVVHSRSNLRADFRQPKVAPSTRA